MVLNSKSSKKTDTCLQDKKINPIKLFIIVIIRQYFRIIKITLTGCLAKTSRDKYLKLSPQSHISFYKSFLATNIVSPPKKSSVADTL